MRQLDGDSGEMADALMATNQEIDCVFGWLMGGSDGHDLVQHCGSLSRKSEKQNQPRMNTDKT
jgi:hypothetical protein